MDGLLPHVRFMYVQPFASLIEGEGGFIQRVRL